MKIREKIELLCSTPDVKANKNKLGVFKYLCKKYPKKYKIEMHGYDHGCQLTLLEKTGKFKKYMYLEGLFLSNIKWYQDFKPDIFENNKEKE